MQPKHAFASLIVLWLVWLAMRGDLIRFIELAKTEGGKK